MDDAERAALRAKYERVTPSLPSWARLSPRGELGVVCALILVGLLFSLRMPLQRSDDFYKVIGAMSLAAGQGYCDISRPDAPFLTKYPPLGALLMAPFIGLVGDSLRPLRLLSIFSYLASVPLLYRLLKGRAGHRGALALLLLAGLNPITLRGLNFEGNAGLMNLTVIGVIALLEDARSRFALRHALGVSVLLALYFYLHRMGIVLALAVPLYVFFVLRERRLALVTAAVTLVLVFPWLWRSYWLTGHWISPEYEAEIQARAAGGASVRARVEGSPLAHLWTELKVLPSELGYGLFPWSHASGGQFWPFLVQLKLTWVAVLGEWLITGLLVLGWASAFFSKRTFLEYYLVVHTLMLLVFFVGFHYYFAFLPWLYLYVAQAAKRLLARARPTARSRILAACFCLVLLVNLGKDAKAFWLFPMSWQDRDLRWAWVASIVPKQEAVYYLGLSNYALSQLRFFDSRRMAVGLTEEELERVLDDPASSVHWLCLAKVSPYGAQLKAKGWEPVAVEPDFTLPPVRSSTEELSKAQQAYRAMIEPPQALWHHR